MSDINVQLVSGRLTKDPVERVTKSGTPILDFQVASNRPKKTDSGWEDNPSFIKCVEFGKAAERHAADLKKGMKVFVEGWSRSRQYEQDGRKVTVQELVVDRLDYVKDASQKSANVEPYNALDDEDIPF